MFWGQWVAVLVTEKGEGKEGIMFPAGCTQVNSSLASPDHTGPGLGLREAALPLSSDVKDAATKPSNLVSLQQPR